jgi:diacylglycerol kinase (ATP)
MDSPFKGKTGLKRLINAFGYSIEGFKSAFKNEDAFRQELILAIILIPTGILIGENGFQKALLVSSILAVLIVELLNSGIEATVDRISLEKNSLAKRAKDIGSAAVFLTIVNAILTWLIILFF